MEARAHDGVRLVPWESWQLWNEVREAVFSASPDRVSAALNKIAAWRARNSLPVAVEVTWDLISIQRTDPYFMGNPGPETSVTDEMLRLMYAMAIMRLINGVVDHSKRKSSLSVADRAEAAGLPRMLVDIRHEVAHQELPSLSYLRLASKEALEWLKLNYWEAQKKLLDNARKNLQHKLEACSQRQGGRRKSLALRIKKLIGPVADLSDGGDIDGISTDELMWGDAEEELFDNFLCLDDSVDALLHDSQCALESARRRLWLFGKSSDVIPGSCSVADVESLDTTYAMASDAHFRAETQLMKDQQSSSKGVWAIVDSWKPCAIGMLPSEIHSVGVLPFPGKLLPVVAEEAVACQVATVQEKPLRETDNNVPVKKATEAFLEVEIQTLKSNPLVEKRSISESEVSDIMLKRLKTDNETQPVLEVREDLHLSHSDAPIKNSGAVQDGPELFAECRASLSAGGFLLLDGVYQRCTVDQLASIRSSIQILK